MTEIVKFMTIAAAATLLWSCDSNDVPQGLPGEQDDYNGPHVSFNTDAETEALTAGEIDLHILTPDGTVITRHANHSRSGNMSTIRMANGLKEGEYRLLSASYPNPDPSAEVRQEFPTTEFGLGSRILVAKNGISIIDSFNPQLGYAGRGTKESPYVISSWSHLFNLMMTVNDYDSNREIPEDTYFEQVCDIDMKQASRSCDMEFGWLPIGADTNTPFRGVYIGNGHKVMKLFVNRPHSAGIGLFGFVHNATIDGVRVADSSLTGEFAVGAIAGASIASGGTERAQTAFTNCSAENVTLTGDDTSAAIGGIIGATDINTRMLLANCTVEGGSVSGGMNIGGVAGGAGMFSSTTISGCTNTATVTSRYSGAGGMIGTADTLQVTGCRNGAMIRSVSTSSEIPTIGTGGIAGGAGQSWITASTNSGEVTGEQGVGGIIGSTRVKGSEKESFLYNQSYLRYCSNTAPVSGRTFVGGAIGEAQAGTYAVCNTGDIDGDDYIGGIVGNSSIAVVHNAVNAGRVTGKRYVAGIIGKTTWGSIAINQNNGAVSSSSGNTAGIVSLAGNNTIVHYCSNFGTITGPSGHPVGGIVGEIGDPRKWTAVNIAECVVGSAECIMAAVGPLLAVVEGAFNLAEGVEIFLKATELFAESCLQVIDYALLDYSIYEFLSPENEEELSASIHAVAEGACNEVKNLIEDVRQNHGGDMAGFGYYLSPDYRSHVKDLCLYYESEGNDEKFNEAINRTREERAEALEKAAHQSEVIHTVVAGVAVAVSTVALIGGTVASGGAATAFLIAGSTAALVGGVNAITKSCLEFEHNAVVISQCVNSGTIKASGNPKASSIAGVLEDGAQIYDCLNTATVNDNSNDPIVGSHGKECGIFRCVSLTPGKDPGYGAASHSVVCDPSLEEGKAYESSNHITVAARDRISDMAPYDKYGFEIGSYNRWSFPFGTAYPIPNVSQMQE